MHKTRFKLFGHLHAIISSIKLRLPHFRASIAYIAIKKPKFNDN